MIALNSLHVPSIETYCDGLVNIEYILGSRVVTGSCVIQFLTMEKSN